MRLLHTQTFELTEFGGNEAPPYAILSHTWGENEVTLQDIQTNKNMRSEKYAKVKNACDIAAKEKFNYIWIDTCCIDKTSSAELSEALNSMYRWYQDAEECYAYLADVPENTTNGLTGLVGTQFRTSRWFTRGWTLQELIAPATVTFLDREWQKIGTKSNLQRAISEITGIPDVFLLGDDLEYASIAQRMSWASKRKTKRIEDLAYCLMGLFGIYMPMLYGEGERAFIRLQEEIIKVSDDHSIFAWTSIENHGGLLATSPAAFANSGNFIPINRSTAIGNPSSVSSRGVCLSVRFIGSEKSSTGLALLRCTEIGNETSQLAIRLRDVFLTKQDFVREECATLERVNLEYDNLSRHPLVTLHVRQWRQTRNRKMEQIEKLAVKLEGVKLQELESRIANLDSDVSLTHGLMIINPTTKLDGTVDQPLVMRNQDIIGRLFFACKDGTFFQMLLRKHGRSISADISNSTEIQDPNICKKEHNDQDQIVKSLGNGRTVHVAIEKRVLLHQEKRSLTGVVEISYSSTSEGPWLDHIVILDTEIKAKNLLWYAALRGLKPTFMHLLSRGSTNLNAKDAHGRTLLSWAAEGGQEAIVSFLLGGSGDNNGEAPLLKLKRNFTHFSQGEYPWIDSKDNCGLTPLAHAAGKGYKGVVKLLLNTGKVDVNSKDENNQTPLSLAAMYGQEGVVKLLLTIDKVDVNSKDTIGRTPLSFAAMYGQEGVVKLLLAIGKVDVKSKDRFNRTPLMFAARLGHEGIVKLLLNTGKARC